MPEAVCDVALDLGWSPRDVMRRLTFRQLWMLRSRAREKTIDWTEMQSAIVWSMFAGKWRRPGSEDAVKGDNEALSELSKMGFVVNG